MDQQAYQTNKEPMEFNAELKRDENEGLLFGHPSFRSHEMQSANIHHIEQAADRISPVNTYF